MQTSKRPNYHVTIYFDLVSSDFSNYTSFCVIAVNMMFIQSYHSLASTPVKKILENEPIPDECFFHVSHNVCYLAVFSLDFRQKRKFKICYIFFCATFFFSFFIHYNLMSIFLNLQQNFFILQPKKLN